MRYNIDVYGFESSTMLECRLLMDSFELYRLQLTQNQPKNLKIIFFSDVLGYPNYPGVQIFRSTASTIAICTIRAYSIYPTMYNEFIIYSVKFR